jgi:hypothetical protein
MLFKIFVSLLTLSVTVVSILGGLSAFMILMNPDNIGIDPGKVEFDFNPSPFNINFTLPFNLTNAGYFDLENLELKVEIAMNYSQVDDPLPGVNSTRLIQIFNKSQQFGTILQGATGNFNFTGQFGDFYFPPLFNFTSDIDWYRGPPALIFYTNLTISLDYSIGMHSLTIGIYDLKVYEV